MCDGFFSRLFIELLLDWKFCQLYSVSFTLHSGTKETFQVPGSDSRKNVEPKTPKLYCNIDHKAQNNVWIINLNINLLDFCTFWFKSLSLTSEIFSARSFCTNHITDPDDDDEKNVPVWLI